MKIRAFLYNGINILDETFELKENEDVWEQLDKICIDEFPCYSAMSWRLIK